MPRCEENTDGVQRQGQRPQAVTGTWTEGAWFAFLAILYMIAIGYAMSSGAG
jgi:hypothetical protein